MIKSRGLAMAEFLVSPVEYFLSEEFINNEYRHEVDRECRC